MRLTGAVTMDVMYTQKMSHKGVAKINAFVGYFPNAEKVQYSILNVCVFLTYRLYLQRYLVDI